MFLCLHFLNRFVCLHLFSFFKSPSQHQLIISFFVTPWVFLKEATFLQPQCVHFRLESILPHSRFPFPVTTVFVSYLCPGQRELRTIIETILGGLVGAKCILFLSAFIEIEKKMWFWRCWRRLEIEDEGEKLSPSLIFEPLGVSYDSVSQKGKW